MATSTVTNVVTTTVTGSATPTPTYRAPPQGGIFEGGNPTIYNPSNPITLFIIQAGIVIVFCRLLHWPLSKLRQPRVIAEVIGGILLGPSVMGRIPGFTETIFPPESIPNFSLVAQLGLLLFLFLVGLEVDLRYMVKNWQVAVSVGAAGMALPFGLGCAISYGLYYQFRGEEGTVPIAFPTYMLFIAIAMAITAFPVLCRILTELQLLNNNVGVIVLSAGVCNDVVGWILLALCVALVNAANGITALWILLTAVGYTLFLSFLIRPVFMWYLRRSGSLQDGPTQTVIGLTLLLALTSAFFTGAIGIHPIFGAFLVGLICPHEGGFAIKVTEKVEDLVSALLLPLYFALSGLSTNLGLLNSGIIWAYVIGVIAVAFFGKVIGGTVAARANGLIWRECFTIGVLMSCKGLVELIVLNIGLQAKILSSTTFTIFVVMALVTTFATTPLVSWLYPPWYQRKLEAWKRHEIDWDTGLPLNGSEGSDSMHYEMAVDKMQAQQVSKLLVYLRLDSMPGLLALTSLFGGFNDRVRRDQVEPNDATMKSRNKMPRHALEMHGLRLVQLTERESSVMRVSEAEEFSTYDPLVNSFRAFGRLHNVCVSGEVAVVPESYYADTLTSRATDLTSDLLLVPWSETGSLSELQTPTSEALRHKLASGPYQNLVYDIVKNASCSVAIFVNNEFGGPVSRHAPRPIMRSISNVSDRVRQSSFAPPLQNQEHHIFVPYVGSADDRSAVRFVLQLARDARVHVTILHLKPQPEATGELKLQIVASVSSIPGEVVKNQAKATTQEEVSLEEKHAAWLASMTNSLPADISSRINIDVLDSENLMEDTINRARSEVSTLPQGAGNLVVVGRNCAEEESSVLGTVGDTLVEAKLDASLLVMQAGRKRHGIPTCV